MNNSNSRRRFLYILMEAHTASGHKSRRIFYNNVAALDAVAAAAAACCS